jgi:hypothetical protein
VDGLVAAELVGEAGRNRHRADEHVTLAEVLQHVLERTTAELRDRFEEELRERVDRRLDARDDLFVDGEVALRRCLLAEDPVAADADRLLELGVIDELDAHAEAAEHRGARAVDSPRRRRQPEPGARGLPANVRLDGDLRVDLTDAIRSLRAPVDFTARRIDVQQDLSRTLLFRELEIGEDVDVRARPAGHRVLRVPGSLAEEDAVDGDRGDPVAHRHVAALRPLVLGARGLARSHLHRLQRELSTGQIEAPEEQEPLIGDGQRRRRETHRR